MLAFRSREVIKGDRDGYILHMGMDILWIEMDILRMENFFLSASNVKGLDNTCADILSRIIYKYYKYYGNHKTGYHILIS